MTRQAKYIERNRALGLCLRCPNPAAPYHVLCTDHLQKYRDYSARVDKTRKTQRVKEGRCYSCGTPLIEGETLMCQNCKERWESYEVN